jgi:MFS family permease
VAIILLVPMGAASISFIATNNATLQLRADPAMRGRVMSLNAIAFLGSTPIGAPLLGYISDISSPRVSLIVGGWPRCGQHPAVLPRHPAAWPQRPAAARGVVGRVQCGADDSRWVALRSPTAQRRSS